MFCGCRWYSGGQTGSSQRVVDRLGGTRAVFDTYAPGTRRALLEAEGVLFRPDGTADLEKCQWSPI